MPEELFKDFVKSTEVPEALYITYESILPKEILEIWKNYGLGSFMNGYLQIINPDEYRELVKDTYLDGNEAIPIMVTAFGDVLIIEEQEYIGIIKYKNGDFKIIDAFDVGSCEIFLLDLKDDYYKGKYFEIPQYEKAIAMHGKLAYGECFGYMPLLGLGGAEKVENLQKVKIREHIELITQTVGNIGM